MANKEFPVVDHDGVPLLDREGNPVTVSVSEPNTTDRDGNPAVLATETNTPPGAKPETETSNSGASASDGAASPSAAPAPASDAPASDTGSAATPAAAPVEASPQAEPASQGSGVGAMPPRQTDDAPASDTPPASGPASQDQSGTPATASDPATPPQPASYQGATPAEQADTHGGYRQGDPTNPNVTPSGTAPETAAMASDDPRTPQNVATTTHEAQAPSEERPNPAFTTTTDATTVAKAKAEMDAGATAPNTPAKVLEDAMEPADLASSNVARDPDAPATKPLVIGGAVADGLTLATNAGTTQEGVTDIGAGAHDATAGDVLVAAPAAGNRTSDGGNASAVDPTGYVAPVRVSAAGVPADDPNLRAVSTGDFGTGTTAAGTSDRPGSAPSTGADATSVSTQARLDGNAQARNPATTDPHPNDVARTSAYISSVTGQPAPSSLGDKTMSQPVAAGDRDAAERVASMGGAKLQNPDGSDAGPFPPSDGTFQPLKPQTPEDAANALDKKADLPPAVRDDIFATVKGPQDVSELPAKGTRYEVEHTYEVTTTYSVVANSTSEAVNRAKAGDGVKVSHDGSYDSWEVSDSNVGD